MDIICKECGMIYTSNEVPEGFVCLCKSKEFKLPKNAN
ncbi:MAG: hypothetical protein QT11_C0001G0915 [archaeon GW2011_AR20]|nr:MAG: hypothetical protein QT11_C0001G0915 [archaeon GW2011_AR20]